MPLFPLRILVLIFLSLLRLLETYHYTGHPFIMSSLRTHDTHTYCWTPFSHHMYYAFFSSTHFGTNVWFFFFFKFTHMETSPLHGASVYNVISQDPWHSHLLLSVGQWSCNNLFLRLILVCRGWIRTPNLACGANALTHCANAASLVLIGLIMINLSA